MPDPVSVLLAAAGITLVLAVGLWPDKGVVYRWRRMRRMSARVLMEDAVKHIHKSSIAGREPTLEGLAGALGVTRDSAVDLLAALADRNMVELKGDRFHLTADGRDYALHVIRAHRLWERYLADETGFAETEWHGLAEEREHELSPAEADELSARLGHPTHDPHGDPIPTAEGELVPHGGRSITTLPTNTPLQLVHIEDEPEAVYAQLVAEGLEPGMIVVASEISPNRVTLWAEGDEHVLAPVVAANLYALPLPTEETEPRDAEHLSDLAPGERGRVIGISGGCRGAERRRLMDLGVVPGTVIEAAFASPAGEPMAYVIRGALIALRDHQAARIRITREEVEAA